MSGICGIFNLDGAPVSTAEIESMTSMLERRGPDRTGLWREGPVAMGHTLLTTTPELAIEPQPVRDAATGCVITADVRLDNRGELLSALGLADRHDVLGDAGLILAAYLRWGDACVDHLLGDFAFVIWDPRERRLFCARDHFGMRPFYYHHAAGRFFMFASEPRAILVLPQVPYRIDHGRVADALVSGQEWIDFTSTFFEEVCRLAPAHALTVPAAGMRSRKYWELHAEPLLRLPSDEAYSEAFLEVFTAAVRCRLRSAGPVGSMLSGGMDSGSVVAIASELLAAQGRGPLPTFSAVGPDPERCVETRAIHTSLTMPGLAPTLVDHTRLDALALDLERLLREIDEPFDANMTALRAVYLLANRHGVKVLLDGAGGDVALGHGDYLTWLLRRGQLRSVYQEQAGLWRFFSGGESPPAPRVWLAMLIEAGRTFAPGFVRAAARSLRHERAVPRALRNSLLSPALARRVDLAERLRRRAAHGLAARTGDYREDRARMVHCNMVAGRERYDRTASALGVEPRDPFMDRRLMAFSLSLPGDQLLRGGWRKILLRHAMADRLPNDVRWRSGKEHLGGDFTTSLMARYWRGEAWTRFLEGLGDRGLDAWIDRRKMARLLPSHVRADGSVDLASEGGHMLYEAFVLDLWASAHAARPQVACSAKPACAQ